MENKEIPFYDVLIVGAGLSGIAAAYHIQSKCPDKSYAVLEGRAVIGGTWDLFKYPGIRSDSDMYTLGFSFNPWESLLSCNISKILHKNSVLTKKYYLTTRS